MTDDLLQKTLLEAIKERDLHWVETAPPEEILQEIYDLRARLQQAKTKNRHHKTQHIINQQEEQK